jgi:hypothetical protein
MVNTNIQRQLIGGDTSSHIGSEIEAVRTKSQAPILQKAVVIEVIADPSSLSEQELNDFSDSVNNSNLISVMPANSIIATIVSNNGGNAPKTNTILFPFFSSHMQLPVKVGETVYVLYEDSFDTGTKSGYWFTRISSQSTVEDVNFTHYDRKFDPTMNSDNYSTSEKLLSNLNVEGPGFPNGGNTSTSRTLRNDPNTPNNQDPFTQIKTQSKTDSLTTNEPVPRFKKRPGDYVIQGSNNTLISLGEDRTGPLESTKDRKGQSGTVDIVVGRGRKISNPKQQATGTSTRVVLNSKNELETDKSPYRYGSGEINNPKEGDPDLINDAARLYISMQTNGDENFNLSLNTINSLALPKLPEPSKTSSYNKSYMVGKADHIRMVARNDNKEGVAGTVLLIREGVADEDLGYFFIDDKGKIQIESKKIHIGLSTKEDNPIVCYKNYHDTILSLQAQIDTIIGILQISYQGALGNLGAPIPSFTGNAPLFKKDTTDDRKIVIANTVAEKHSKKIFVDDTVYPETKK